MILKITNSLHSTWRPKTLSGLFLNFVFRENTISNFYISSFNDFFDFRSMRGGKSITSGSPMSPGSFVSSESAGSSNSLDETDDNRIVTPIDDHMGPATIFEVRGHSITKVEKI